MTQPTIHEPHPLLRQVTEETLARIRATRKRKAGHVADFLELIEKHLLDPDLQVKTLRTWAEDDDPGLSRTMAQLDRSLRDGADWISRLETPATLATALASLARGFMKARKGPAPGAASGSTPPSPPQADPNSPTSNPDAT